MDLVSQPAVTCQVATALHGEPVYPCEESGSRTEGMYTPTSHDASHARWLRGLDGYKGYVRKYVGTAESMWSMNEGDIGMKDTRTLLLQKTKHGTCTTSTCQLWSAKKHAVGIRKPASYARAWNERTTTVSMTGYLLPRALRRAPPYPRSHHTVCLHRTVKYALLAAY